MNADRRKTIEGVIKTLRSLVPNPIDRSKIKDGMEGAVNALKEVESDETEAFENLSDGLQSHRQDSFDEVIAQLEEAIECIESLDANEDDEGDVREGIADCIEILETIN